MKWFWQGRTVGSGNIGRKRRMATLFGALVVIVAMGAVILSISLGGCDLINPGAKKLLNSDTFHDGVFVDDLPLGGLTKALAKSQIEAKQKQLAETTGVTVTKDEQSWQFLVSETSYSYDTDAVLDEAWKQGREGTEQERLTRIRQLPENPVRLQTTITIDPSPLEQRVRELALPYAKPAVDAIYLGYDLTKPDGERLSFSQDVPGEKVDEEALWAQVKKEFTDRTYGSVPMQMMPVDAAVKQSDLQARMQLVRRWNSVIKDHSAPRLKNIELSSAAFSGRFIMPGEVLSFNDTTGRRDAAKGYQIAHIINGGVTDNGMAGGTCQTSGTLWNVAVRADLEIVERTNHTLKSAYMKAGEDATVNYGSLDLKIKNNKNDPVLLIMYISKEKNTYKLYGEVYGVPLAPGVTIELKTVKTGTVPAPAGEARYVPSEAVKRGTTETNKAKDGEKFTTYKLYLQNGKETRRVVQHTSYYPASGLTIVYNPADGIPTPTPSPTPTPTLPVASPTASPVMEPTESPAA